jgi:urease subunit beta
MIPGEILPQEGELHLGADRAHLTVRITNTGDRPVQVGSHFHIAEANPALRFDRVSAWGYRLDVPSGTAVRFEPGVERDVDLVAIGGARRVLGLRRAVGGDLDGTTSPATGLTGAGIDPQEPA